MELEDLRVCILHGSISSFMGVTLRGICTEYEETEAEGLNLKLEN